MTGSHPPRYNPHEAETRWQKAWESAKIFATPTPNPKVPDYFVMEMFPYPSGNIHMGHVRNYALGDVVARFRRMQGYNVLYPMGWDAFGLPAENAAIQNNVHPKEWTLKNIATMREQLKSIGLSYDWSREVTTCNPEYYRHEQKFFLEFLKRGIAYRKEAVVNWDPIDNTVLANEQVIDGRGWRSGALVERRSLSQWFLRITDYAEELLEGLNSPEIVTGWPEKVRIMQEKWIGKSSGALVTLKVLCRKPDQAPIESSIEIYTTRPDTFYGMSFVAIAPEHPLAKDIGNHSPEAARFIRECSQLGTSEEAIEKAEKKGFDTGLKAINPFTGEEVPLYIANFVLMGYGTGAIFGCPAHDERDFEFATKYQLPILPVVQGGSEPLREAYTGDGVLMNSPLFNGMTVTEAKEKAIAELETRGIGQRKVNYRLRDWGVSRQRYWGCPIPVIYCADCGAVPVPEAQLPVTLPDDVTFDTPGNPLAHHPTWKHVPCPTCGKPAQRETDTFDTFFESSWYFACYASGGGGNGITADAARFMPVNQYIGGIEHAVLHLLYSRFFMRALRDCNIINVNEPFRGLMTQGMVTHATFKDTSGNWIYPADVEKDEKGRQRLADGTAVTVGRSEKMSKSKRNTVDPRHIINSYGADTARLFMLSDSPPERDLEWTEAGIDGAWRYLQRLHKLMIEVIAAVKSASVTQSDTKDTNTLSLRKQTNKTIDFVTKDIENFHFNKAIARIRELTNLVESSLKEKNAEASALLATMEIVVHVLAPFLPHVAEELWAMLGREGFMAAQSWPKADPNFLEDETVTMAVQINGKLRATLVLTKNLPEEEVKKAALAHAVVQSSLAGKTIRKTIVVPNRIINMVAA